MYSTKNELNLVSKIYENSQQFEAHLFLVLEKTTDSAVFLYNEIYQHFLLHVWLDAK